MKTSELTGAALDWAVAQCEGLRVEYDYQYTEEKRFDGWWQLGPNHWQPLREYSSDWAHGGPIVERERLCLGYRHQADLDYSFLLPKDAVCWARATGKEVFSYGSTPLIAAMRCYVASKLGDEVQIPEELTNENEY